MSEAKAVILVSGGPDSATSLFIAKKRGFECHALTINYGQRAQAEIKAARAIAAAAEVASHHCLDINLAAFQGSALTNPDLPLPPYHPEAIPISYVPARNIIFLSVALSLAETLNCGHLFIGAHIIDYNNYPDCRPAFFDAYTKMAILGTKRGQALGDAAFQIHAPLIQLNKAEIFLLGQSLGVNLAHTISCYDADDQGQACGQCSACQLRREGFIQAGLVDLTLYR